ncbi:uncharacterized protein LOC131846923 [Achroia grisella]|uniref:uncharacterized protein LOC131846923 n=1 Tax=Achroia grisella TaxID=688607 RepID=UPI0027D26541|nr:uncharacterized protein LOC131846923 [Achroia grisella]
MILDIISVYAPQTGSDEDVKAKFWEDFDENEEVYVGGDFNGHVPTYTPVHNENYDRVHGDRSIGIGIGNEDGETLLETASAFDLAIVNTWFKKKEKHLITKRSPCDTNRLFPYETKQVMDCERL